MAPECFCLVRLKCCCSCREIIFGIFWPNFGQKRSHHVMDASCRWQFLRNCQWKTLFRQLKGHYIFRGRVWAFFGLSVANPSAPQRDQRLGQECFGTEKGAPFSGALGNGRLLRNGDSLTQSAVFWGVGKWEFFCPETLFSRILGILTLVGGGFANRASFWNSKLFGAQFRSAEVPH